ncbi:MAG: hypothetical protein IT537_30075 [Hyphomicrobiales bacterium]|nr:hypothetical protein [Hyphomicrobiales bacterium]
MMWPAALRCALTLALALLAYGARAPASAQNYPSRPITIIVSLAAGTGMDTLVRLYGERLSQSLGQPVVIENKPGGAGVVAGETIVKSAPDGYTLAVATSAVMSIRPTLFKVRPFNPLSDFIPVSLYATARSRSPTSPPGTSPPGTSPPRSRRPALRCHFKDGKLRAIAVTSLTRLDSLPNVPSIAEAVAVPDFEAVSWHMLFARQDTARPIVDKLHLEMKQIMATPDMREKIANIGLIPHDSPSVDGMEQYVAAETEKWGAVVRQLGLAGSQ